jgi:hypothetical protein
MDLNLLPVARTILSTCMPSFRAPSDHVHVAGMDLCFNLLPIRCKFSTSIILTTLNPLVLFLGVHHFIVPTTNPLELNIGPLYSYTTGHYRTALFR